MTLETHKQQEQYYLEKWSFKSEIKQIFDNHMYPMTLHGVEDMTAYLAR